MFKPIIILFLIVLHAFASPLIINDQTIHTTTANNQITIEDKAHTFIPNDILQNKFNHFSTAIKASYTSSVFWTKSDIQNNSEKTAKFILRNLRAGIDNIDVYIYENDKLVSSHILGDLRSQNLREIISSKSSFALFLAPHQKLTIITKYSSFGSLDLFWDVLEVNEYSKINGAENIAYGLFGGIILALMIYNLMMFFNLKEKMLVFYVFQGLSLLWFVYAISGIFYLLDFGLDLKFLTFSTWYSPVILLIFSILFVINFFDLKNNNKFFYHLMILFLMIDFGFLLFFVYAHFFDQSLFITKTSIYSNISFLICLIILIISFWAVYKRLQGALYIAIGQCFYLSSLIYVTFLFRGELSSANYSFFVIPLGVVCEMIFFALALGNKIKQIKTDAQNLKIISLQHQHFTEYGKLVGNIAHQWKQPLAYLSSEIVYFESLRDMGQEDKVQEALFGSIPRLSFTIDLMAQTVNMFSDFYKNNQNKEIINPKDEIKRLIKIYHYKIVTNNITIDLDCQDDLQINTYRVSFLQIFMSLFDESIEKFERLHIQNKTIAVKISNFSNKLSIFYEDNCVDNNININEIFLPNKHSSKFGLGMGMHVVKTIIETKLKGSIKVTSATNTIKFIITIPIDSK